MRVIRFLAALVVLALVQCSPVTEEQNVRRLPVEEYVDKMKAGWIGQMVGVGWGGPTEFRYRGVIMPPEDMPVWEPSLVNQFTQDDIYVEMTFLQTLERYGMDVSIHQAGIDFANSEYRLWHANRNGRDNLRAGIGPPDSGHPQFNKHADEVAKLGFFIFESEDWDILLGIDAGGFDFYDAFWIPLYKLRGLKWHELN